MLTFFHGWRRKMGAATLVMACAFMTLWVRSYSTKDSLIAHDINFIISSELGEISWHSKFAHPYAVSLVDWWAVPASQVKLESGFFTEVPYRAKYWFIVLPLIICSACLLLSKPKRKLV